MIADKDPYIQSAYRQLQFISQDKQKQLEYEAREKAILDYNQSMFEAEQRGMERGMEHGIKCGMERICKLQDLLLQHNRFDDLARSSKDADYRQSLFEEFGI